MRALLTGALALAAAISLGGQGTLPPEVKPPSTTAVGQARPPQKPAPTQTSKAISSGELSGRVVDDGNRGIADAVVWLIGSYAIVLGVILLVFAFRARGFANRAVSGARA